MGTAGEIVSKIMRGKTCLSFQAGFYGGSCAGISFLGPGICDLSCGRCTRCPDYNYCKYCTDSPPDSAYTCAQQVCAYIDVKRLYPGLEISR